MKTKFKPSTATNAQICRISRDNFTIGDCTIMTDGFNTLIRLQKMGEMPTQEIDLPRPIFNRLIAWYQKEQVAVRK